MSKSTTTIARVGRKAKRTTAPQPTAPAAAPSLPAAPVARWSDAKAAFAHVGDALCEATQLVDELAEFARWRDTRPRRDELLVEMIGRAASLRVHLFDAHDILEAARWAEGGS